MKSFRSLLDGRGPGPRRVFFFLSLGLFIGWLTAPDFLRHYEKSVAGSLTAPPGEKGDGDVARAGRRNSMAQAKAAADGYTAAGVEAVTTAEGGEDDVSADDEEARYLAEDAQGGDALELAQVPRVIRVAWDGPSERFSAAAAEMVMPPLLVASGEAFDQGLLSDGGFYPAGFSGRATTSGAPSASPVFPRSPGRSPAGPSPSSPPPPGGSGGTGGGGGDGGPPATPAGNDDLLSNLLPGIAAGLYSGQTLIACFKSNADPGAIEGLLAAHSAAVTADLPLIGCSEVSASSSSALAALASDLAVSGLVSSAQPDILYQPAEGALDALYPFEWSLQRIGVPAAWDGMMPNDHAVVAVLDTGFDVSHPDLKTAIRWTRNVADGGTTVTGNADHGTRVAGILAAVGDNGYGIAGVNKGWADLALIKVFGAGNTATSSKVIQGIAAAQGLGAKVANLSLSHDPGQYDKALCDAIGTASGLLFVIAAGNSGSEEVVFPAGCGSSNILSVASTDSNDRIASVSNRGTWVDIAAPGENILTTAPMSLFAFASGTSMAAPHVAGVASMLFARDPSRASVASVRSNILTRASPVPGLDVAGSRRLSACGALGGC